MVIYDESGIKVDSFDVSKGYVETKDKAVLHTYKVDVEGKSHLVNSVYYEDTDGWDQVEVIDVEEKGHWETTDAETGEVVSDFDGAISDNWPHEIAVNDVWQYGIYHPYSEEQLAQIENEKQKFDQQEQESARQSAEIASFFAVDGGKDKIEAKLNQVAEASDPALVTFAKLSMPIMAPTVKDASLAAVCKYSPEYVPSGHSYKKGEVFQFEGKTYRVSQDFTSQEQWVPGSEGLDALFYEIEVVNGVVVWHQPRGEFDSVNKGDRVYYPDLNGSIYESLVNGNVYSPDAYPANWKLVQ